MANAALWGAVLKADAHESQDAIHRGANVNFQGTLGGDTALHLVCSRITHRVDKNEKLLDIVKVLILAQADLAIKNNAGNTALNIAKRRKYLPIVELLQDPSSCDPPPPPTPPPTPPKQLEELDRDELLEKVKELQSRLKMAERKAIEAENQASALKDQNQKLMQQSGYNFPVESIKKQELKPLPLPAGINQTAPVMMDTFDSIHSDRSFGDGRQQLQPLDSDSRTNGMSATVSEVGMQGLSQGNRLQASVSSPALGANEMRASGAVEPEVLLKQMLQRGDISFKEYKQQLQKLAQR